MTKHDINNDNYIDIKEFKSMFDLEEASTDLDNAANEEAKE